MGEAPLACSGGSLTKESIQTFSIFVSSDQTQCKLSTSYIIYIEYYARPATIPY